MKSPSANEEIEEEIPKGFQIKSKKRRPKAFPFEGKVAEAEQRKVPPRRAADEVEMIEETPSAFQQQLFTIHWIRSRRFHRNYSLFTIH
ncbi:MAG: hypothetical protein IKI64_07855 [Clostridia bacterium]|nr:hypothetical protein [Clostridia bacterium]